MFLVGTLDNGELTTRELVEVFDSSGCSATDVAEAAAVENELDCALFLAAMLLFMPNSTSHTTLRNECTAATETGLTANLYT